MLALVLDLNRVLVVEEDVHVQVKVDVVGVVERVDKLSHIDDHLLHLSTCDSAANEF